MKSPVLDPTITTGTPLPGVPVAAGRLAVLARFALADFGKSVFWRCFEIFALFYLVEVAGIDAATAGAMIMVSLIWSAVADPLSGALIDWLGRRGFSYRFYFTIMPTFAALSMGALFAAALHPATGTPAMLLGFLLVFRTVYGFVDIPANAATVQVVDGSAERSLVWGLKKGFATAASLLLSLAAVPVLKAGKGDDLAETLLVAVAGFSLAAIITYALAARALPPGGPAPAALSLPFRAALRQSLRHGQLWLLVAVVAVSSALSPMLGNSVIYLARHVVGNEGWAGLALSATTLGGLAAIPLWTGLSLWRGRLPALRLAYLLALAAGLGFALLPPGGHPAGLALLFLYGMATGGAPLVYWSMTPDLLDDGASRGMGRCEALPLSLLSFAVKIGAGLGAGLLGLMLAQTGVDGAASTGAGVDAATLHVAAALMPAAGAALCLLLLCFCRLRGTGTGA